MQGSARSARYWVRRYLPSEIAGTLGALGGAWLGYRVSGSLVVAAGAGTLLETVAFYAVAVARTATAELRSPRTGRQAALRTAVLTVVEFGPAEVVDSLLVRPGLLWLGPVLTGSPGVGWLVGKLAADVVFYLVAGLSHVLSQPRAGADRVLADEVRRSRVDSVLATVRRTDLDALVALHGTPLVVLEPAIAVAQLDRLRDALPFLQVRYAVKAQPHPAVLGALHAAGSGFDVAGSAELDAVLAVGAPADRVLHSQPVKTAEEICYAYQRGVRLFVVDCEGELAKFRDLPDDARVLVRLGFRTRSAKSDLGAKFGLSVAEAERLLGVARSLGVPVAGFAFHVGSQVTTLDPWRRALTTTLALVDRVQRAGGQVDVLDLGGGFPVAHRTAVPSVEQIAGVLGPLLEPRADRLTVLAEPGRLIAAETATLVTRVIGRRIRDGRRWVWADDGVYGTFSNVLTEDVHPVVLARHELDLEPGVRPALVPTTVAGPTCDSAGVVGRDLPLPPLVDGDLLVSPAMGAYTTVTSTTFNGRAPARVVVVGQGGRPAEQHAAAAAVGAD